MNDAYRFQMIKVETLSTNSQAEFYVSPRSYRRLSDEADLTGSFRPTWLPSSSRL